jgi:hypothetical protein
MVTAHLGSRMWQIGCPAGCYRLPAPSTAKGAKWFYESESQAQEEACRLHDMMQSSHKERR